MKRKIPGFMVLFLLGWLGTVAQQQAVVMGLVRDASTKEPLPGVNVIVNSTAGTVTGVDGRYRYDTDAGEVRVEFRFIGYNSEVRQLQLSPGEARILNINLGSSSTLLNTVVVSAGKFEQKLEEVTVSMEVIKPEFIENTAASTMDVALEQSPGVVIIDGQANIRGGSGFSYGAGSRVLVMVDDLPLLASDANDVKWNFIPVENIEQVEVIKGASSALFGSSAMNGVINVRTGYAGSKPETSINWQTGWYDEPKREELKWWGSKPQLYKGLSFNHKQKVNQLDLVVGGNAYFDDGYRMGESEERYRINANTRYRFKKVEGLSAGINANITFNTGGNYLLWENDSSGAYIPQGGLADSTTTISYYETTRTMIDPFLTYTGKKGSTHKLRTRYFKSANRNNTAQQAFASSYYAEYQYQKRFGEKVTLTGGIVDQYADINSELYENHTSNNLAGFAQADLVLWRFNVSLGGRIESNQIDGEKTETIPVLRSGMSYRVFKHTHLRASYGQGYRYPSIAEKYVSTQVGNIVIYPNDSIESEKGWSAEIGLKQGFRIGGWEGYIDAAWFQSEYRDMMEFTFGVYGTFADPFFGFGFKSLNIGNTRITGYDLGLVGDGMIGNMPMTLFCGYTYIDPIYTDFDPAVDTVKYNSANFNILKYRYKQLFKGDIEINPGLWMFGISARYNSFMENIDKAFEQLIPGVKSYREEHNEGDWVWDLRAGYRITDQFRFSVIVRNLLNHEYMGRPADMQPPRSYTLQLGIRL